MQALVTTAGAMSIALLLTLFIWVGAACRGESCGRGGTLLLPLFVLIALVFAAGVATWRAQNVYQDNVDPGFKTVVTGLGIVTGLACGLGLLRVTIL